MDQVKAIERAEREPETDEEEEEGAAGARGSGAAAADHGAVADRLRQDALESMGHLQRRLAHRLRLPPLPSVAEYTGPAAAGGRLLRGHRLSVTAVALTADERTAFSVGKEGSIMQWDVETGARLKFAAPAAAAAAASGGQVAEGGAADWVKRGPRQGGRNSLLAAAVSSDGRYLAVGGGDRKVHIWDARSRQYVRVSLLLPLPVLLPLSELPPSSCCACWVAAGLQVTSSKAFLRVHLLAGRCLARPEAAAAGGTRCPRCCCCRCSPSRRRPWLLPVLARFARTVETAGSRNVAPAAHLQGFPGHKDAVTSLAFREGTHELFRCGEERWLGLFDCNGWHGWVGRPWCCHLLG